MGYDCMKIAEFLAWESHNILWVQQDWERRLKIAFDSAHKSLTILQQNMNS